MPWLIFWTYLIIAAAVAAFVLWLIAPSVPGLRVARVKAEILLSAIAHAFRTDPPPLYIWTRNLLVEIADEFGPQLRSSTNRNAALLAMTGLFGTVMPDQWAQAGAATVIGGLLIFYLMRTWAGRKRAAGPIWTPRDVQAADASLTAGGPGAELERGHVAYADPPLYPATPDVIGGVGAQNLAQATLKPSAARRRPTPRKARKPAAKKTARKAARKRA